MLKPVSEAFLIHDLYKLNLSNDVLSMAFTLDEVPKIKYTKVASKGARFVYCETDRKDAQMGWYADDGSGVFREGILGWGKMSNEWARNNLTEPKPITGTRFRDCWISHPELKSTNQ
jgi:hypothetical protein